MLSIALLTSCASSTREPEDGPRIEFEGIIRYAIETRSKSPAFTDADLQEDIGTSAVLYYKHGNCRMTFNGEDLHEVYFDPTTNTEYTVRRGIDSLFFGSCDTIISPLTDIEEEEYAEKILGLSCHCMTIETEKNDRRLCYSPTLYVDPAHFKDYRATHYDRYYAIARAPFLSNRYIGKHFEFGHTAVSIEPQALPDSLFRRPDLPLTRFPTP